MRTATLGLALLLAAAVLTGASSCDTLIEQDGTIYVDAPAGKCWSGAIGNSTKQGCGSDSLLIEGETIIVGNAQKEDDGRWELCLRLEVGGDTVDTSCTDASYGIAQVSEG